MDMTERGVAKTVALLLLLAAITQPIYTAFFIGAPEIDRRFLWRVEGLLFIMLACFAGTGLVLAKRYALGFSAIAFAAIFKLLAVGLGLTQFFPFAAAGEINADLSEVATSIVAFSFFCYNAANVLLGLAAIAFGLAKWAEHSRAIGAMTTGAGIIALTTNAVVMMFGFQGILPSPVAGSSGVLATVLVVTCLLGIKSER
ncbi:MAG: thiamine biosynthesis protein ThiC [Pseudomonadota bacterium]